jgi:DMSO/TMAO reductase YedYZ heme-binding membrane subunit
MENQVNKDWQTSAFEGAVRNKETILFAFKLLYFLILSLILITFPLASAKNQAFNLLVENVAYFGRVALFLLFLVVTPGILGRFNIQIKVTRIITLFRRNLGILMYLIVLTHYHLVNLPKIAGIEPFTLSFPLFQSVGFFALVLLSFLFITSNNFSVKKLGKWWKRIHRLIYVILLLVLIHTALQRVSIYSVLAAFFVSLEIASLIYNRFGYKVGAKIAA